MKTLSGCKQAFTVGCNTIRNSAFMADYSSVFKTGLKKQNILEQNVRAPLYTRGLGFTKQNRIKCIHLCKKTKDSPTAEKTEKEIAKMTCTLKSKILF